MPTDIPMLEETGASSHTNAILIPHSPGHLSTLTEQMRNAMMEADPTGRASALGSNGRSDGEAA